MILLLVEGEIQLINVRPSALQGRKKRSLISLSVDTTLMTKLMQSDLQQN